MFFNEEIRLHLYDKYDYLCLCRTIFYNKEQSYTVEYPNEIQLIFKNNFIRKSIQIIMKNRSCNGKISSNLNNIIRSGILKTYNIKAKTMMNYFIKLNNNYAQELENTIIDEKIQILIKCIDLLVELLYPFAELYANRFIRCYQFTGFSTFDKNKQDPFQKIIESKCNNKYIKNFIKNMQISLPGYDSKLPRVVLEYGEESYEHKLK